MNVFTNITTTGWVTLLKGLSNPNSSLEKLNLVGDEIGDEGAHAFAAAIANDTSLKSLEFNYVDSISTDVWMILLQSLLNPDSSALVELNLINNNIDDEGLSMIGSELGNNSTLKTLNLKGNGLITPTGGLRSSSV